MKWKEFFCWHKYKPVMVWKNPKAFLGIDQVYGRCSKCNHERMFRL